MTPAVITTAVPARNDVVDIAEHLLALSGSMDAPSLHSMLYLSQGWNLAWTGEPLFDDEVQAWSQGPVVASLHELHAADAVLVPGDLYEARRRRRNALLNRERVKALRSLVPTALALRTVRRAHRASDRAARLDGGLS